MLPCYQMLSQEQVATIHGHTLDLLGNTGVAVRHRNALERLKDLGARVDFQQERVYFSPEMVETALASLPKTFTCAGREREFDITVSQDASPVCRTTGGAVNMVDLARGTSRPVTLQDCRDIARIADGLENTGFIATQTPCDVPVDTYDITVLKAMLESGRKHIWSLVTHSRNLAWQIEMMTAMAGSAEALADRPGCHGIVTVLEQFQFPEEEIERLLLYGRHRIPIKVPVVPMMGTNAPTTIAGTMVQANAEAVAGAVLIHLLCPSTPTWYYFFIQAMDKRTGGNIFMGPEIMLCALGLIQMARYYGLPAAPSSFETTGARTGDILFGNGASVSLFALAGAFEHASTGCVDMSMGISTQGMVMGDDIWAATRRLLDGFCDEKDAFALDAVKRVSRGSGHYLTDSHTRDFLRKEPQFVPHTLAYRSLNAGQAYSRDTAEEAQEKVDYLLAHHEVPPLEPGLQQELDRIETAAIKDICDR